MSLALLPLAVFPALASLQGGAILPERWSVPLGPGFSGPAVAEGLVVASFRTGDEIAVVAHDAGDGSARWRASFHDPARAGQEDYGGGRGPHATPTLHRGRAHVLGYGGTLATFSLEDGRALWSRDLVEELGAAPVQFGFAAAAAPHGNRLVVQAGGEAGVLGLDAATGETLWSTGPLAASYVTPRVVELAGVQQALVLARDVLLGLDPATGEELWRWELPGVELTNYAMLLPLMDGGLEVSGQGVKWTACLDVTSTPEGLEAGVGWSARGHCFSHGAIVERDGFVYGSNGRVLGAFEVRTGQLAFKLRRMGESNLVSVGGGRVLRVSEEGAVSLLELRPERVRVLGRRTVLKERAWAPPAVEGGVAWLRDAERLVALELAVGDRSPIEDRDTGFRPGEVRLPRALLAFAHGQYATADGRVLELRHAGGELTLLEDDGSARTLVPRSETRFELGPLTTLELEPGEAAVPEAIVLVERDVRTRARRVPTECVKPGPEAVERLRGRWEVPGVFDLTFQVVEEGLRATGDAYGDIAFRVQVETAASNRLWLRAVDAPYGIPDLLLERDGDALWIHQASETWRAVRP